MTSWPNLWNPFPVAVPTKPEPIIDIFAVPKDSILLYIKVTLYITEEASYKGFLYKFYSEFKR